MTRLLSFAAFLLISISAHAQVEVAFTQKELDAAFTLMRPELNSIELDGKTGVYTPAPSLKFLGVEKETFVIDMGWIANIADLGFNHVKAKMPQVAFQAGTFQVTLPIEDRDRAVQSRLGSISLKDVSLTAVIGWKTRTDQRQELVLLSTRFDGKLSGSGVLRSSLILGKTKELMMKLLTSQVKKIIAKPGVQNGLQSGLLNWAKFYTGTEFREVTAGSLKFFNDANGNGLGYQVQ